MDTADSLSPSSQQNSFHHPNALIDLYGIALEGGAGKIGTALGVWDVWYNTFDLLSPLRWRSIQPNASPFRKLEFIPLLVEAAELFVGQVLEVEDKELPYFEKLAPKLFLTSDHSCAMLAWGAMNRLVDKQGSGPLGLLWVDAHMDSHTPETSPTKNVHGMPLAHLLGYGEEKILQVLRDSQGNTLDSSRVCIIGTRSYEPEEEALLDRLGVQVIPVEEVKEMGFDKAVELALAHIRRGGAKRFGVSFDVDVLDPKDFSSTGCLVENGLRLDEVIKTFSSLRTHEDFAGLEITEYNPLLGEADRSREAVFSIIHSVFGYTPEAILKDTPSKS